MRNLAVLSVLLSACVVNAPEYSDVDGGGDRNDARTDATLTITLAGNGSGAVTAPQGIDCGTECTLTVPVGTTVTLTATPEANTDFTGWSGDGCSGTAPCELTLTADTTVEAAFDLSRFTLTVIPGGNGTGTVTADPTGIDCGADCFEDYDVGTPVTLTATPAGGSTFLGWTGGGCTGIAPCTVEIGGDLEVQASFALDNSIVVTLAGNGTGGVTSDPDGIACEDDCSEAYGPGIMVTLTALATGDSVFNGWSGGGCSGVGTCEVTTDDALLVTATFILNQHTLQVVPTGTGTGLVTSNPEGIDCGADCSHAYDSGTPVVLTATPTAGKFAGWTGDCSGLGTCTTVLAIDRSVTATFTLITVGNVTSTTANGIYSNPTSIPILLTFSDPVTVTGAPTLALDTGGVATYASGSGTTILTFTYVVAAGQASSDLEYAGTIALALNGGTIKDGLGNNATLTLPIPGAPGSLGANKAIVIDSVPPVVSAITGPAMYAASTSASLAFTVSDVHLGATSNCTLTAGTGTITSCSNTGATLTGLNQGAHTLQVTHTDTAGNVSAAQSFPWIVDTVAPVVSAISGPGSYTQTTTASFTYAVADANAGSTSCALTVASGTQTACTNTTATFADLSVGSHTVSVFHTDLAGNPSSTQSYTWNSCPSTTFTIATSGSTFTVPSDCGTKMDMFAWGGGGGGESSGAPGASAGFATGTLTVSPGEQFTVTVGGGGAAGGLGSSYGGGGTNGGGSGGAAGGVMPNRAGGGGGGWSGIRGASFHYVVAAGGGGAGGGGAPGIGGPGGGTFGGDGQGSYAGYAGTQTQGGARAICDGNGCRSGTSGAAFAGGSAGGARYSGGGGGGGGRFGGGGGAAADSSQTSAGGGGGGSSYINPAVESGSTLPGTVSQAGGNTNPNYIAGTGVGGMGAEAGNAGLVVIVVRP